MPTLPNLVTIDLDAGRDGSALKMEAIVDGLLEVLDQSTAHATFFIPLGVAKSSLALPRITDAGHEIGCLSITRPDTAKPYCADFVSELEETRAAIEHATGVRVRGHRNAPFAVDYGSEWAYDVLVDCGFDYDSSRFPSQYVEFGQEPVPRFAHAVRRWGGTLLEIPVSTTDVLSVRMQLGSTGSIRGIPLPVWRRLVGARQTRGEPLIVHLRASELGRSSMLRRSREGPDKPTLDRVRRIVGGFPFTSVARAFADLCRSAPTIEN